MPFTVQDFDDLIRLLDAQPEWREALRRRVLGDEWADLPRAMRRLADAQAQTEQALAQLTQRVDQLAQQTGELAQRVDDLTQRLDQLTQRVDQLAQQTGELAQRVDDLTQRLDQLAQRVDQLAQKVDALVEAQARTDQRLQRVESDTGRLKGMILEMRYAERPYVYFKDLIRRARTLEGDELYDLLERADLADEERYEVIESDLVAVGRMKEADAPAYLVAEVSWGIGPDDVTRAARRAALLSRAGLRVIPAVAGEWITPEALDAVAEQRVWYVLGGRAIEPR